jgi:hypothetical protein
MSSPLRRLKVSEPARGHLDQETADLPPADVDLLP